MKKRKYVFKINFDEKSVLAENKEEALDIVQNRYPYEDIDIDDLEFAPTKDDFEEAAKKLLEEKDTFIKDFAKDSWAVIERHLFEDKVFKFNPYIDLYQYDEIPASDVLNYLSDNEGKLNDSDKKYIEYLYPLKMPSFFYSGEIGVHPKLPPKEWEEDGMYLFTIWCKEFKKKAFFSKGYAKFEIYSLSNVLTDLLKELNNFANESGYKIETFIGCVSYYQSSMPDFKRDTGGIYEYSGIIHKPSSFAGRFKLEPNNEFTLEITDKGVTEKTYPTMELVLNISSKNE